MSDLEDDIARVAALRGKSAADYSQAKRRVAWAGVDRILSTAGLDPDRDLMFFDALPQASRAFIREQSRPLSSMWWAYLLHEVRDEQLVIEAVRSRITATQRRP